MEIIQVSKTKPFLIACACLALTELLTANTDLKHGARLLHSTSVQGIGGKLPIHLQLVEIPDNTQGAPVGRVFELRELSTIENQGSNAALKTLCVFADIPTHDRVGGPPWKRSGAIVSTDDPGVIFIAIAKATQNVIIVRLFRFELQASVLGPTPARQAPNNSQIAQSEIHVPGEGGNLVVKELSVSDTKLDIQIGRETADDILLNLRLDLRSKRLVPLQSRQ